MRRALFALFAVVSVIAASAPVALAGGGHHHRHHNNHHHHHHGPKRARVVYAPPAPLVYRTYRPAYPVYGGPVYAVPPTGIAVGTRNLSLWFGF